LILLGVALIIAAGATSWMPDNPFTTGIGGAPRVHSTLGGKPRPTKPEQIATANPADPGNVVATPLPAAPHVPATTQPAPKPSITASPAAPAANEPTDGTKNPGDLVPSQSASASEEPPAAGPDPSDPVVLVDPPVSTPDAPDTSAADDNPVTLDVVSDLGSDPGPEQSSPPTSDSPTP
jgi:hypothetical protein